MMGKSAASAPLGLRFGDRLRFGGVGLLVLGILLIVASWLPLGWTRNRAWTAEDAAAYDRIGLEYHESAYQTAARAGRTEEEMDAYRAELKQRFEQMRARLELAQDQPQRWSRFLLWSGCVFLVAGYLLSLQRPS